jgi:hypothetical protein
MFRELSLLAARRAKRSGDYLSALSYIQTARALGNAGTVSDFMLDIEEAGCEFALGHLERTRELCDAILPRRADRKSAGQPAGGSTFASRTAVWRWRRRSAGWGVWYSDWPLSGRCRLRRGLGTLCNRANDAPQHLCPSRMENPETEAVMNLLYSASICASFICPRLHFCCSAA